MSDSAVPPADPSPPADGTLPDGPAPDREGGDEPWTVRIPGRVWARIPVKVWALAGTAVAAVLVAVLVVALVVNRGPDSPMEVVDDFVAAARAGDVERFESHLCGDLQRQWREMPTEEQLKNLGDMTQAMLTMNWQAVREEIDPGGERAAVMFTYTDETGETVVDSFSLNLEDGRWKVCG